ncbi:MAG: GNAT family N-acetyltransferase [Phycisphaerales bacterium JB038]
MATVDRSYDDQRDRERVFDFLVDTHARLGRPHNWLIDRWINLRYSHYADSDPVRPDNWQDEIHVWEEDDAIVAAVLREGANLYAPQVDPAQLDLEPALLAWAEADHQARRPAEASDWPLRLEVYQWDTRRQAHLLARGYEQQPDHAVHRRRSLVDAVEAPELPSGFKLRAMQGTAEAKQRYVETLGAIFPHYAAHWEKSYPNLSPKQRWKMAVRSTCPRQEAPAYRRELDLCIETSKGALAAVCTFWFDARNELSIIEPMGVVPEHRGLGLSRAIMLEGMRRSRVLGARRVDTTSYAEPAHQAYESVGLQSYEAIDLFSKHA